MPKKDRCTYCDRRLNTVIEGVVLTGTLDFQYTGKMKVKEAFCCLECLFDYIYEEYLREQEKENSRDD